jgi:ACS family glucarate transporter-like MFS transporter
MGNSERDDGMTEHPTATGVRHRVIAVCSLMAVLLYLDRYCISFAEVYIKQDFGLTDTQVGWMLSAFFWTYALGQVFAGWLGDRYGGRRMLTIYVLAWSLLTALTGFATGFVMLMTLRFGFGAAQAGAYPTAANLISKWVPISRRGFASSIVSMGGRIGGTLALLLTGYVIVYLVPPSTDSMMKSGDVLGANRSRVFFELLSKQEATNDLRARIRDSLSTDLQRGLADRTRPPDWSDLSDRLIPDLNAIISKPDFFRSADVTGIAVEKEAKRLLARENSLSQQETERLNRLVLEAIFPSTVRKIYGQGWRQMMLLYGSVGVLVAGLLWWLLRDSPQQHPAVNDAELALIEERSVAAAPKVRSAVGGIPVRQLLSSQSMWLNGLMQFFTNIGWVFLVTATPRYFADYHRIPVEDRSWMTSIPTMAAWIGMFTGGILTDRLAIRFGLRWGRTLPIMATRLLAASAYLFCLFHPSPWFAVAAFSLASLACDLGIPAVWAFQQDVGGKYAGSVLGWGNMFGNFGAAIGPPLFFWAIGNDQNWNRAFLTCAAAFALSGFAALGIDPTKPVVRDDVATDETQMKHG